MEIVEIFSKAITYPLKKDFLKIILLFLLIVIPLTAMILLPLPYHGFIPKTIRPMFYLAEIILIIGIIIVSLIFEGYAVSVMREGITQSDIIPSFEIKRNIVDTLKVWILSFIFSIIPSIIITILMFIVMGVGGSSRTIFTGGFIIAVFIGVIIGVIFAIFLQVAILRLAEYGSLSEALSISELIEDINQIGIGKLICISLGLFIISGIILCIGIFLIIIPIIGYIGFIVLPLIIIPYIALFTSYGFGLMYSDV
jgi:hypothetical protein